MCFFHVYYDVLDLRIHRIICDSSYRALDSVVGSRKVVILTFGVKPVSGERVKTFWSDNVHSRHFQE